MAVQVDESAVVGAGAARGASAVAEHEAGLARRRRLVLLCQIAFGLGFIAFWQWASGPLIDPFFVSSPFKVFARLWQWIVNGTLWLHLSITLWATAAGFGIGGAVGFVLGLVFGRFKFVADVFDPFITAIYSLPKIALAPLFIMWFGIGIASKIAVAAAIVFFVVFLNTFSGVREVNPLYIHATRIMGASHWAVMRTVIVPSAAAWVIAGLKVSVPYALVGAVIGEFMSANRGVGFLIAQASALFDTTSVFTGLFVLALAGAAINSALKAFEAHVLRWRA